MIPGDLAGSASTLLAPGVRHLAPEEHAFEKMLMGWAIQQQSRFLKESTISIRRDIVRRFARFTNQYPWEWTAAEVEEFVVSQRTVKGAPVASSTARGYQNALRCFMDYVTDPRYEFPAYCHETFGQVPVQILHEWNSVKHVTNYEGDPRRRALTYDEVQTLFDAADSLIGDIRDRGRKGSRAAHRDAILLKTIYAFGLRRREAWGLDIADLRHNPAIPAYARVGGVFVRFAKSSKGSPPRRRTVKLVPEMDWLVPLMDEWIDVLRPDLGAPDHPGLWTTERRGRLALRGINDAFVTARDAAGLPEELDLHCLRHSYITHLAEFGYPERFIQEQVGHSVAASTAVYTHVSDDYSNQILLGSLERQSSGWEFNL